MQNNSIVMIMMIITSPPTVPPTIGPRLLLPSVGPSVQKQ